jgi:predicted RNase H-like HicB family nuclease
VKGGFWFASPALTTFLKVLFPVKQWSFRIPRRTWEKALYVPFIRRGMETRLRSAMAHYIAITEDAGPDHAVGIWFPDLPGCFSAGDDIDEALHNAPEALELYAESLEKDGKPLPAPRTLTQLNADPEVADDIQTYMVALIELPARAHAAE